MSINHITNNPDSQAGQDAEAKAIADKILDNFELPESLATKIDEAEKDRNKVPEVEEEEVTEEETPDVAAESETKETAESDESEESAEEEKEDEELIPKSKFQKRLDEMTREKKILEARLRKLEESNANPPQAKDEDLQKLEKMSESELVSLKKQVRLSQIKSANDDATLGKLMDLEDKIDSVRATAPQRFQSNQIQQFNDAVQMSSSEIQGFDKVQKDIFGLAKRIYDTAPELHASVTGQARAWNLAVEHFKLLQESNIGKTKIAELSREKNTLKQKVSVGGNSKKSSAGNAESTDKLFSKAKYGDTRDKVDFIRKMAGTDAIVDSFMANRS